VPLEARAWGVDYLVLSAHNFYGPKGSGALVSPDAAQAPLHLRLAGHQPTPNTPAHAGLGEACRLRWLEMADDEPRIEQLRDRLEAKLHTLVPDLAVNGSREHRLAGNLHVSARGAANDMVVAQLRHTVAISTGAACASGADAPSHVLRAMGLEPWRQETALRIGLGRTTTVDEIDFAATAIAEAIRSVRAF
jgi:cysteine desulfurase